jgi:hypothetical protein
MSAAPAKDTHAAQPTLTHSGPPTFDDVKRVLNRTVLSPLALVGIPLLGYLAERRASALPFGDAANWPFPTLELLRALAAAHPRLYKLWLLVLLRTFSHTATRYVRNLGVYGRQRPDWRKEVVVITGGAAGIGKATVEILSHKKRARIAVLDMAPPQYARAPPGAPEILYFKTDVTDRESVKKAADAIRAKYGEPTILMNCAGEQHGRAMLSEPLTPSTAPRHRAGLSHPQRRDEEH